MRVWEDGDGGEVEEERSEKMLQLMGELRFELWTHRELSTPSSCRAQPPVAPFLGQRARRSQPECPRQTCATLVTGAGM